MNIWLVQRAEPLPIDEGQQRLLRTGLLAESLVQRGHDVLWWTSTFNHSLKTCRSHKDALIHVCDHYRIWMMHGGGYKKNRSVSRFVDQRILARKFKVSANKEARPDIIICSLPSVELCLACVAYGRRMNVPVVLDMRDMWPDIFVDVFPRPLQGLVRFGLGPLFWEAQKACSMATAICGITDAFVDWGLARGQRKKTDFDKSFPMGYKAAPPQEFFLQEAQKYWDAWGVQEEPKELVVCFSGAVNWQFDLETAILAVRKALSKGVSVKFIICGSGDRLDYFKKLAEGEPNIIFTGFIDVAKLYVLMRRSALGLDPLPDRYDYLASINNKAIEYFSAGLPVISCPKSGVLFELLKRHNCGLSYTHGNVDELAGLLLQLNRERGEINQMADKAKRLFEERFSAEKVYQEMSRYIEEIARTW